MLHELFNGSFELFFRHAEVMPTLIAVVAWIVLVAPFSGAAIQRLFTGRAGNLPVWVLGIVGVFVSPMEPAQISDVITAAWPGAAIELHSSICELVWPEGWRVLVRRSGTEPLTRCYVEGPNKLYRWFNDKLSK